MVRLIESSHPPLVANICKVRPLKTCTFLLILMWCLGTSESYLSHGLLSTGIQKCISKGLISPLSGIDIFFWKGGLFHMNRTLDFPFLGAFPNIAQKKKPNKQTKTTTTKKTCCTNKGCKIGKLRSLGVQKWFMVKHHLRCKLEVWELQISEICNF